MTRRRSTFQEMVHTLWPSWFLAWMMVLGMTSPC
jgi:hypothetical protein